MSRVWRVRALAGGVCALFAYGVIQRIVDAVGGGRRRRYRRQLAEYNQISGGRGNRTGVLGFRRNRDALGGRRGPARTRLAIGRSGFAVPALGDRQLGVDYDSRDAVQRLESLSFGHSVESQRDVVGYALIASVLLLLLVVGCVLGARVSVALGVAAIRSRRQEFQRFERLLANQTRFVVVVRVGPG